MPDVVTAFHPYYTVTKEAISKGEWPLWNIYELAGMPLLANCQTAAFYPPRLLHCFLNVDVATTIYILLKLWLCGMAAFWCARTLALTLPASRFFSVAWMLASYNVIWCNWSLPDVSVWLPVLFAATELILEAQYRRGFLLTAIGGALILLAGHPETAFAMSLGLGRVFRGAARMGTAPGALPVGSYGGERRRVGLGAGGVRGGSLLRSWNTSRTAIRPWIAWKRAYKPGCPPARWRRSGFRASLEPPPNVITGAI